MAGMRTFLTVLKISSQNPVSSFSMAARCCVFFCFLKMSSSVTFSWKLHSFDLQLLDPWKRWNSQCWLPPANKICGQEVLFAVLQSM